MRKFPSCSIIVSTYNTPEYLIRTLQSIAKQYVLPDEIVIADDGSDERTQQVIEQFRINTPVPVVHVWHPDEGFRLSAIRNKAIAAASSEYIIIIDGDILLNKYFVYDHLRFAKYGCFTAGKRTILTEKATTAYLQSNNLPLPSFWSSAIRSRSHTPRCRLLSQLFSCLPQSSRAYLYVIGCNMAFWKKDLISINGYNEAFKGWGKEDNDIAARLCNLGIKLRFLQFQAILFHLYHPENTRNKVSMNIELLQESVDKKITCIQQGIYKTEIT